MQKVIGIEKVDYNNKQGSHVLGVRIFVTSPISEGVGDKCNAYFISGAKFSDLKCGEILTLTFEPGFNGSMKCTGVIYK